MTQNNTQSFEENPQEPYTISLFFKELGLLSLILFLGFTGFTLCVDKIYEISEPNKIEEITVHDSPMSSVDMEEIPKFLD